MRYKGQLRPGFSAKTVCSSSSSISRLKYIIPICTSTVHHHLYQYCTSPSVPVLYITICTSIVHHHLYQYCTSPSVPVLYITICTSIVHHHLYQYCTSPSVPVLYITICTSTAHHHLYPNLQLLSNKIAGAPPQT